MVLATFSLKENYWEEFELQNEDIEFIYAHLLEVETPLTPQEIISVLKNEFNGKSKLLNNNACLVVRFICPKKNMKSNSNWSCQRLGGVRVK